jgi:signal transduction histidine kinase/CheY-like chemotaxis protein
MIHNSHDVVTTAAGRTVILDTYKIPLYDSEGQVFAALGYSRDVTELKRTTEALQHAKEVAELANRAKSEFLANMSHELRTPLNGILGYAQILQRDKTLTPAQQNGVSVIQHSGEHLLNLINDILDLSKIEAGRLEIHPTEFHLDRFLQGINNMIQIRAQDAGLYFKYQPLTDLPLAVMGDEKRLRQILINLLGNAIKFTKTGGVTFKVGPHYGKIRFQIEDTGIGIADNHLEQIFQPFRQVGDVYKKAEGTGLGLSISKRLAEALGSDLKVMSTFGQGTIFWLDVDLPVAHAWKSGETAPAPLIVGYTHVEGRPLKVLVVDDKTSNRRLVIDMLTPLGFEVFEAVDGQHGIEQAEVVKPDIILMDIVMPNVNGLEATRQIRQHGVEVETNKMVIIAASASAFENDQEESLAAGCDDFLPKPIHLDALLKQLEKHLAVEWIHEKSTETQAALETVTVEGATTLPPELARQMYEFASKGRIKPLRQAIDQLEALGPQYQSQVNELKLLVKQYQVSEIQKLLEPYLLLESHD